MSTLALLGKNFEHLVELIVNQKRFNSKLKESDLFDEINEHLQALESDKIVVSWLHRNDFKPIKVVKTNNFQFIYDNFMTVAIANKYF